MAEHPSRFALAQYHTEDLPAGELAAIGDHLHGCDECGQVLREIEDDAATYESRGDHQRKQLLERLQSIEQETPVLSSRRPAWRRAVPAFAAVAVAAMVGLVLLPRFLSNPEVAAPNERIAFKGTMSFEVVAKREAQQFRVEPGAELREGDSLRFVVSTSSAGYLAVFSVDGQGRVSSFYPDSDPGAAPEPLEISAPGRHELPGSIILDDAHGDEYYVVTFADTPFDRRQLVANPAALVAGDTGPGQTTRVLRVEKSP